MKKLKYGIILLFSMILFSAPVLAAQTYYLPSKIEGDGFYLSYTYDKYGHIKNDILSVDGGLRIESKWKYKYDKNGKRVSGEMYRVVNGKDRLLYELTFDKNQYLKTSNNVGGYPEGHVETFTWNKEGYLVRRSDGAEHKYYIDSKFRKLGFNLRKRAFYLDGKLGVVSLYDEDGLLIKSVIKDPSSTTFYKYTYNKKGLVNEIIRTEVNTNSGKVSVYKSRVFYSKTKTDKKTYAEILNGHDSCFSNALL